MLAALQCAVLLSLAVAQLSRTTTARLAAQDGQSLTVSELVVVDARGVVRARLGGNLPDAVIDGKAVPRGQRAAGVLLYDETGLERGGFLTFSPSGHAVLTLDSRRGQSVLLAAEPNGGSALRLWHLDHAVELNVGADGPAIHATESRRAAFHEPPVRNPLNTELCRELRQARGTLTPEALFDTCVNRSSEAACRACVGRR